MSLELSPGIICSANDRVVQIDGVDSLTHVWARDVANGEILRIPIAKVQSLHRPKKPNHHALVPEVEWKRCAGLAEDLFDLREFGSVGRDKLAEIALRHQISVRQLQRMRVLFRKNPRATALVRDRGGRRVGANRLDPEVDAVIKHTIEKYYFRRERACGADIVERARSVCRRLKLNTPSRNAVMRRLKAQEGYVADRHRFGTKEAKQKWEPRPGRLIANRPLELFEIDHTLVDIMVLSDDRTKVLGRPWLSVAIDVATRCVMGFLLTMDAPSAVSVSLCLSHAVLPKAENESDPDIWPMYGKPERILVDNGKDFRSMALMRGCEEHGISLEWRPVRTPHYGAHIERLIGTLMKLTHLLPGTTFSNSKERGSYDSESRARFTLNELRQWFVQKIGRYYHVRKHRSLGLAPVIAWESGRTNSAGVIVPPPIELNAQDFRIDFLPFEFRPVRRTGIEFKRSRYWHDELAPLLNCKEHVMVRFDPGNLKVIWVRRPDGLLVEVPAVAGRSAGDKQAYFESAQDVQNRLDGAIDDGLKRCDEIEDHAQNAGRRKRISSRGKRPPPQALRSTAPKPADLSELVPCRAAPRGCHRRLPAWPRVPTA